MSADPYSSEPTRLRWMGTILSITKSDASSDPQYHPQVEDPQYDDEGGWKHYQPADEDTRQLWLGKIANYLVYESRMLISSEFSVYCTQNGGS